MKTFYDTHVMYRGKLTPLAKLKPYSKKQIGITCPECSTRFKRYAFVLFRSGSFLCERCRATETHSKHLEVGKKYGMLTIVKPSETGYSIADCECGERVKVFNTSVRTNQTKSCGCLVGKNLSEWRKNNPQEGIEHPRWKGGVTDERRALMSTKSYKDWRSVVFKRDGYQCLKCGQIGGELNAHHVSNYADNKELATDIDNGVTLCKKCHDDFHEIYTRRNNNQEQLDKFLEN